MGVFSRLAEDTERCLGFYEAASRCSYCDAQEWCRDLTLRIDDIMMEMEEEERAREEWERFAKDILERRTG